MQIWCNLIWKVCNFGASQLSSNKNENWVVKSPKNLTLPLLQYAVFKLVYVTALVIVQDSMCDDDDSDSTVLLTFSWETIEWLYLRFLSLRFHFPSLDEWHERQLRPWSVDTWLWFYWLLLLETVVKNRCLRVYLLKSLLRVFGRNRIGDLRITQIC